MDAELVDRRSNLAGADIDAKLGQLLGGPRR
jgi:hypothetical protein